MPETTEAPEHRQCRQRTDAEETAVWWANLRRLPDVGATADEHCGEQYEAATGERP